jgi:hypothetical protein
MRRDQAPSGVRVNCLLIRSRSGDGLISRRSFFLQKLIESGELLTIQ